MNKFTPTNPNFFSRGVLTQQNLEEINDWIASTEKKPLFISGPLGSGKSTLARMIAGFLSSGDDSKTASVSPNNMRHLPDDDRLILFDNVSAGQTDKLSELLSTGSVSARKLGSNFIRVKPLRSNVIITGDADRVDPKGDLQRRCIVVRLNQPQ